MSKSKYTEQFKYFMASDEIYEFNKKYWESTIRDLTDTNLENWVQNHFANGNEIKDGNPLFSCKIHQNKALRIVQDKRNPYSPLFASWVTTYEFEKNKIEELVIALQPYRDTYINTKKLIQRYIEGKYKLLQRKLNAEYNKKTNYNRISHLLNFLKNTELPGNSWNIKRHEITSNQINYNLFKKISTLNQNLFFYESIFEDKSLKNSFYSTLKTIDKLNHIITLKYSYDLDEGFRSDEYKKEIIKVYANLNNYLRSYNSTVDNLEERYKELKEQFEETTSNKV